MIYVQDMIELLLALLVESDWHGKTCQLAQNRAVTAHID